MQQQKQPEVTQTTEGSFPKKFTNKKKEQGDNPGAKQVEKSEADVSADIFLHDFENVPNREGERRRKGR